MAGEHFQKNNTITKNVRQGMYTEDMEQTTIWKHFVLGYKWGKGKRGNTCWMSDDNPSESISDSIANFGKDGWELVSSIYVPEEASRERDEEIMCFFKKRA